MMNLIFKKLQNFRNIFNKKSAWEKLGVSFKSFTKKERKISIYTKKVYKYEYSLFTQGINLHTNSMGYVYDLLEAGSNDLFYDAFIKLGVKILHNTEAIRNLNEVGLYGSGQTLSRSLVFDTHMLWYLYLNPDKIKDWLEEDFYTYKDKKWHNKFSEKTIIENLKEKGGKYNLHLDYDTDFTFYSKAGHPCHFSIRFFQNEDGVLAYLPDFSMRIGHLLFLKAISLLPYPTQILLEKNKHNIKEERRLSLLHNEYNYIMQALNRLGRVAANFHRDYLGAKDAKDITKT